MRIAVNASALAHEKTGVATYTAGLLHGLKAVNKDDEIVVLYEYFRRWGAVGGELPDFGLEQRIKRFPGRALKASRHFLNAPGVEWLAGGPVDIYHNTGFYGLPQREGKQIASIQDLVFETLPAGLSPSQRRSLFGAVRDSVARADLIITPSQATKSDVINLMRVAEEKIRVIYDAAGPMFKPIAKDVARLSLKARLGIEQDYILFLGAGELRKNLPFLIEGYAKLPKKLQDQYQLVIGGPKRWGYEAVTEAVYKYDLVDRVIFTGYVSDSDIVDLYGAAAVFVFPSLGEGFGLPVLEAMACGTPVICSNTSSLPEVAGTAARLIDPYIVDSLVVALKQVLSDEDLQKQMSSAGLKRADEFSWEKTARQTISVYKESAGG